MFEFMKRPKPASDWPTAEGADVLLRHFNPMTGALTGSLRDEALSDRGRDAVGPLVDAGFLSRRFEDGDVVYSATEKTGSYFAHRNREQLRSDAARLQREDPFTTPIGYPSDSPVTGRDFTDFNLEGSHFAALAGTFGAPSVDRLACSALSGEGMKIFDELAEAGLVVRIDDPFNGSGYTRSAEGDAYLASMPADTRALLAEKMPDLRADPEGEVALSA